MGLIARLFMDPYQKQLVDPRQFKAPVDREQIMAELDAGAAGRQDHQTMQFMRRAVRDVNEGGPLTIAAVADSFQSLQSSLRWTTDRSLHEFGVLASVGDRALLSYLIERANRLAEGIHPGAAQQLKGAFD